MKIKGYRIYREVRKGKVVGNYMIEWNRGKAQSLRTKDKEAAKVKAMELIKDHLNQKIIKIEGHTRIKTLIEDFLLTKEEFENTTYVAYKSTLKLLLKYVGDKPIKNVNQKDISTFKRQCLTKRKKSSLNTYLSLIRPFFKWAVDEGYLSEIPKGLDGYKVRNELPRIFTKKELNAILKNAENRSPEMYRIIKFAKWSCCRRAEILNLRYQDINFETGKARIVGKGDKVRIIPLTPGALEVIGEPKNIGYVFEHYSLIYVSRYFQGILKKLDIYDGRHFHNLRHTAATQMLESDIGLKAVQAMLGHSNLATTQIYLKVTAQYLQKEIEKFKY